MQIDSHQHFWIVGKFLYPWLRSDNALLYRNFIPDDLLPLLQQTGMERTILVQASPSIEETNWMLELAAHHQFIAGVVGWLDFEADDFGAQFEHYRQFAKFVGVRPSLEFIPDDNWLLRPKVIANLKMIEAADFQFDFILWPRHLPAVVQTLAQVPRLRCVIDHIGNADGSECWYDGMREVAKYPNAHCKLSGLPTMDQEKLQPWIDRVLDCFGSHRVMFGSDWPVSLRIGSYEENVALIRKLAHGVPAPALFGDTAARFYQLGP